MARYHVVLYCEQTANFEIEHPDENADPKELVQIALSKLDESGGAEWETDGYTQTWKLRTRSAAIH